MESENEATHESISAT